MRLHFRLSPNFEPVPFNYPHFLVEAFERWLSGGARLTRGGLWSLGWLQNGAACEGALHFPRGATWFVSAPDTPAGDELLELLARAVRQHPKVCCGMDVIGIQAQPTPLFGARQIFRANSPVFLRGEQGGLDAHLLWDDDGADAALTRILRRKLEKAGLGHLAPTARAAFDRAYPAPKTRLIRLNDGAPKKASVCPVVIEGDAQAVRFAWNVGAGNLTRFCFGSLV